MLGGYYLYSIIEHGLEVIENSDSKTIIAFGLGILVGSYFTKKNIEEARASSEKKGE